MSGWRLPFGANLVPGGVEFRVWAPGHATVEVVRYGPSAEEVRELAAEGDGWFSATLESAGAGSRYRYRLDGGMTVPDPASRAQPEGVHGPSQVVDPAAFGWTDHAWGGIAREALVIYELHVGTFTPQGTFAAAAERLDHLTALGITALELMPVAAFPGARNWGYDGVDLFAPHAGYGGPEGLRALVDAAHARGLAVILDVVYNHLGPEGNYLPAVTSGRYFTGRHHTPWGDAVNVDGPESGPVREFIIQNVLHWAHEYHLDGLRLDATHAILDDSPRHLLAELGERVHASLPPGRHFILIAEDERNQRKLVVPPEEGGYGLDGVWADDFHHQLRRRLAGDSEAYFADYTGSTADIAATLQRGWWYEGQPAPSHGTPRGTSAEGLPPAAFVHCLQNHDQVGNRALGDRLHHAVPLPLYRAASALLLLSPYAPLLWMGQEWAATAPFLYFTDHPDELGRRVTEGRRAEFARFSAFSAPGAREGIPDPQAESSFTRSRLDWDEAGRTPHAGVLALYRDLLALRRAHPALQRRERGSFSALALDADTIALRREGAAGETLLMVVALGHGVRLDLAAAPITAPPRGHAWRLELSTEESRFGGEGEMARPTSAGRLETNGPGATVLVAEAAG